MSHQRSVIAFQFSTGDAPLRFSAASFPTASFPTAELGPNPLKALTSALSSCIELPLLQTASVSFLGRSLSARHLHIGRLHVFLRKARADFLVRLGVGFLAVSRAVRDALSGNAGLERRVVRVGRRLGLRAFCAGGSGCLGNCARACVRFGVKARIVYGD